MVLETEIKRPTRTTTPSHQPALTHHLLQLTRCATYIKAMVKDTTAHVQKSIYWASVSKPHLLDKMYVCLYILYVCGNLGSPAQFMGDSTMMPCTVTSTCVLVTLKCLNAKFRTRAMNSHNMDGDHSQTCLLQWGLPHNTVAGESDFIC